MTEHQCVEWKESWGRGIEKIAHECRQHGLEAPLYDTKLSGLMLTFLANPMHLKKAIAAREINTETSTETVQEKIIDLLYKSPKITLLELATTLSLSKSGFRYHLEKLRKTGRIHRIGATKGGHWKVLT
jgi:ATP-dependent DNA helicase RecG